MSDERSSADPRPTGGRWLRALGWPLRTVLIALLAAYQRVISPLLPASCRWYPCCSEYSRRAIDRHGAAKGSLLTLRRLVRCNPWNAGGIDRVPRRGQWHSPVAPDGTERPEDLDRSPASRR